MFAAAFAGEVGLHAGLGAGGGDLGGRRQREPMAQRRDNLGLMVIAVVITYGTDLVLAAVLGAGGGGNHDLITPDVDRLFDGMAFRAFTLMLHI